MAAKKDRDAARHQAFRSLEQAASRSTGRGGFLDEHSRREADANADVERQNDSNDGANGYRDWMTGVDASQYCRAQQEHAGNQPSARGKGHA